jgi:hypothetical protein
VGLLYPVELRGPFETIGHNRWSLTLKATTTCGVY